MRDRLTFLSHFVLCLAIGAAAFFAWINGVPQTVFRDDLSRMTSVIAAIFLGSAAWLGWQAWVADGGRKSKVGTRKSELGKTLSDFRSQTSAFRSATSDFGHLAERLCVMAGLAGTTIGLSLQARALMSGSAGFGALSTSLYTTACGVIAAALLAVLTHNLEAGIRRARPEHGEGARR